MNLRILLLIAVLFGCQSNKNKLDLNFKVKGLKKGKITLKKLNDSSYYKIDSFTVKGNEIITFSIPEIDQKFVSPCTACCKAGCINW